MAMNKDFGPFELKQKIGSGGMASVYLATQKSLQRQVVLKILYPHLAEDEKLVLRFEREARAAAMMRHENIIQVIDCGRQDDVAYICMEFVEGMDLKKWLETHGTPPIEMALLMLRDLCRGLEHAHGHRIIHRDIKPANIMLTPDGTIKLMDFGLARSGSETSTQMTMVGSVMGTPAYMSPEQATGEAVDERSDIFSTGVVAYELLGGARPFSGDSYSTVLRAILTVDPPDVTQFNPLVPEEAAKVVRKMLAKDVSKRYATISQAREELEGIIEQLGLLRGKDLLKEYVAAPEAVRDRWHKKRLSRHLDQGLYFENMGQLKIDDALLEFRRALHLDPDNVIAKEHLKKLERDRGKVPAIQAKPPGADTTITLVVPPAPGSKPTTATNRPPAGAKRAGLPVPALAGIAVGLVLVVAVVAMLLARGSGGSASGGQGRAEDQVSRTAATPEPAPRQQGTATPVTNQVASPTPGTAPPPNPTGEPAAAAAGTDSAAKLTPHHAAASAATPPPGPAPGPGRGPSATSPGKLPKPSPATLGPALPATEEATVLVSASPFANFTVDGEAKTQNAKSWQGTLKPGKHTVRIEHPTLGNKEWDIEVAAGETKELTYDFLSASAGTISVSAEGGWAEIYLDGDKIGHTTPWVISGVLPGKHEVELVREGFTVVGGANTVAVKAGQQVSVMFKLKQKK